MRPIPLITVCGGLVLALVGCTRDDYDAPADRAADAGAPASSAPAATPPATADAGIAADGTATGRGANTPATGTAQGLSIVTTGDHAPYLANSAGSALYMLEGDRAGKCDSACAQAWPPLLVQGGTAPAVVAGLAPSLVGTVGRPDGSTQVTFNGHPLHRYAADTGAGTTAGHGVHDQWGEWYLLTPQGAPVAKPAKP